jgi:rubrerythrin
MGRGGGTMDNDTLFNTFKTAIMEEHKAYEFYLKAAGATTNEEAKKLFEGFAAEELSHVRSLEELYKSLRK